MVQRLSGVRDTGWRVEGERSLVVVCAVIGAFDMNPTNSFNSFSLLILIQMMGSSCSAPCCLQQGIVWTPPIVGLIKKDVQGLLIDPCLRELHLVERFTRYDIKRHFNNIALHACLYVSKELCTVESYLPSSASFQWHKQWRCSILQRSYAPGHKMTNNRSHLQSHLWWTVHDRWTAERACQTALYFSACCHQNCWRRKTQTGWYIKTTSIISPHFVPCVNWHGSRWLKRTYLVYEYLLLLLLYSSLTVGCEDNRFLR